MIAQRIASFRSSPQISKWLPFLLCSTECWPRSPVIIILTFAAAVPAPTKLGPSFFTARPAWRGARRLWRFRTRTGSRCPSAVARRVGIGDVGCDQVLTRASLFAAAVSAASSRRSESRLTVPPERHFRDVRLIGAKTSEAKMEILVDSRALADRECERRLL